MRLPPSFFPTAVLPSREALRTPRRAPGRKWLVLGCIAVWPLASAAQDTDSVPPRRGVLPVIGYSEATGLQYGATVFRLYRVGGTRLTHASTNNVYLARTAKNHTKAFAQVDHWFAKNRVQVKVRAEYISYPLPYFGIGADSPDDAEEWYSAGVTTLHGFVQQAVAEDLYAYLGWRSTWREMRELETNGLLQGETLGERSRSHVSHLQLGLVRDTRDDLAAPRRGVFARAIVSAPVLAPLSGSNRDARFFRQTIDARGYLPLGTGPVIALQVQHDAAFGGRVPFDHLAMIGADTALRGYARGRFRDRQAIAAQAEYRSTYWCRIGFVTFVGVGAVAPEIADLVTTRWHPAAGVGLRYLFAPPERNTVRLDLAFGRQSIALNMGFNEAF